MHSVSLKSRGFSLIEVVIAIGVATVCLVGVVGLLSMAVTTNTASNEDTQLAAMSSQVLSNLRSAPFNALGGADPSSADSQSVTSLQDPPVDSVYYFTNEAAPLPASANTNTAQYKCVVKKTMDVGSRSPTSAKPYNRIRLQMTFTWPHDAPNPQSRTIYASIARY